MPTLALPKGRTRASLLWRDRRHAGGGKHSPASGGSRSGFASTRPVPVGTRPPTQRSSRSASSGRPMASAETPPRSACQKTCGWRAATTSGLECSSRARTGEFRIPASEFGIVRCAGPSSYYCMPHATRTRRWHGSRGSVDGVADHATPRGSRESSCPGPPVFGPSASRGGDVFISDGSWPPWEPTRIGWAAPRAPRKAANGSYAFCMSLPAIDVVLLHPEVRPFVRGATIDSADAPAR